MKYMLFCNGQFVSFYGTYEQAERMAKFANFGSIKAHTNRLYSVFIATGSNPPVCCCKA